MATLTTVEAVKRTLGIVTYTDGTLSVNTDDDDIITDYVIEASQMFETETRRTFSATSGATLTYDIAAPDIYGRRLYFGQDMLGVDRLINGDGSVMPAANYRLLPVNSTPKYALELYLTANTQFLPNIDTGWQSAISINGTTGFCDTGAQPSDVTIAVTKLAAHLYQTRDNTGEIQVAEGFVVVPSDTPKITLRTIVNYKTVRTFV